MVDNSLSSLVKKPINVVINNKSLTKTLVSSSVEIIQSAILPTLKNVKCYQFKNKLDIVLGCSWVVPVNFIDSRYGLYIAVRAKHTNEILFEKTGSSELTRCEFKLNENEDILKACVNKFVYFEIQLFDKQDVFKTSTTKSDYTGTIISVPSDNLRIPSGDNMWSNNKAITPSFIFSSKATSNNLNALYRAHTAQLLSYIQPSRKSYALAFDMFYFLLLDKSFQEKAFIHIVNATGIDITIPLKDCLEIKDGEVSRIVSPKLADPSTIDKFSIMTFNLLIKNPKEFNNSNEFSVYLNHPNFIASDSLVVKSYSTIINDSEVKVEGVSKYVKPTPSETKVVVPNANQSTRIRMPLVIKARKPVINNEQETAIEVSNNTTTKSSVETTIDKVKIIRR